MKKILKSEFEALNNDELSNIKGGNTDTSNPPSDDKVIGDDGDGIML